MTPLPPSRRNLLKVPGPSIANETASGLPRSPRRRGQTSRKARRMSVIWRKTPRRKPVTSFFRDAAKGHCYFFRDAWRYRHAVKKGAMKRWEARPLSLAESRRARKTTGHAIKNGATAVKDTFPRTPYSSAWPPKPLATIHRKGNTTCRRIRRTAARTGSGLYGEDRSRDRECRGTRFLGSEPFDGAR